MIPYDQPKWVLPTAVAVAFVFGAAAGLHFTKPGSNLAVGFDASRQPQNFKFVSPLIDCEGRAQELTTTRPMRDTVENIIHEATEKGEVTHVSVYFRDLNNGPWFGVNEKEHFAPAGLLQLPLLMSALKLADADAGLLERRMTTPSGVHTLWTTLERMITLSDNGAVAAIQEHMPPAAITRIFTDLGLPNPDEQRVQDYIRIKDYASLLRILYNASYISPSLSEKGLELLSRSDFQLGLVAGLPKDAIVAHKSGHRIWSDKTHQLHDCGIVYAANPYLLCVMTRGANAGHMSDLIARVTRACHETATTNRKP